MPNTKKLTQKINLLMRKSREMLSEMLNANGAVLTVLFGENVLFAGGKMHATMSVYLVYSQIMLELPPGDERETPHHSLHIFCNCEGDEEVNQEANRNCEQDKDSDSSQYESQSFDCGFADCGRNCANCLAPHA